MNNPFAGANLDNIKEMNISAVLKKIYEENGISRIDLAASTEMSCAFVTKVTAKLSSDDIVLEEKSVSSERGRPKASLSFNHGKYVMAGLRINTRYVSAALCGTDGELLCHYSAILEEEKCGEDVYRKCRDMLNLAISHKKEKKLLGIGVAAPGPLPREHDRVTALKNGCFADFGNIPIVERLENGFETTAFLLHDAHCGALNEYVFCEDGERFRNIVFIATDNGVGAGIIIDGKTYNGSGLAGEISNMTVGFDGSFIPLGRFLSQERLVAECGCATVEEVIEKILNDDSLCNESFDRFLRYLSIAISNFITTVSPEAIVISDRIALLPERVELVCNESLKMLLPEAYRNSARLIVRPYSKHSVLRGACGAILHRALEEPCKYFNL